MNETKIEITINGALYRNVSYNDIEKPNGPLKICSYCDLERDLCHSQCNAGCVLKKVIKTKRAWIVWTGDIPEDVSYIYLDLGESYTEYKDDGLKRLVKVIHPNELRYGTPNEGETVVLPSKGIVKADAYWKDPIGLGTGGEKCLIIDPGTPTPEPETVEQVLEDMPDTTGYPNTPRGHQSFMENQNVGPWFKRLKAAQERKTNNKH